MNPILHSLTLHVKWRAVQNDSCFGVDRVEFEDEKANEIFSSSSLRFFAPLVERIMESFVFASSFVLILTQFLLQRKSKRFSNYPNNNSMAPLNDIVPAGVVTGDDLLKLLTHARENGYAIPAFNCTRCVRQESEEGTAEFPPVQPKCLSRQEALSI